MTPTAFFGGSCTNPAPDGATESSVILPTRWLAGSAKTRGREAAPEGGVMTPTAFFRELQKPVAGRRHGGIWQLPREGATEGGDMTPTPETDRTTDRPTGGPRGAAPQAQGKENAAF